MAEDENKIDFDNPDGAVINAGEYSGEIVASEWIVLEEVKGVRYRKWKYRNVSEEIVDGALVEVQPGCRTPVQYVETDHVFDENIQSGKFLLFQFTNEGLELGDHLIKGLSVYKFDSFAEEVSFSLQVHKGELMCLYALKDNDKPGEIIECEQPGFSSANLVSVPIDTHEIHGLRIPSQFWETIKMLDGGIEEGLPVDILDVNEEM